MENGLPDFYRISANLTGFSYDKLVGTGVGAEYYGEVKAFVRESVIESLFTEYNNLLNNYEPGPILNERVRDVILSSPEFGPLARNIIKMWYLSIWYRLPDEWSRKYGNEEPFLTNDENIDKIVSRNAYIQGLVWTVMGTHPMGAKQPGFGTWATKPEV